MRQNIVAGNWKMNNTLEEGIDLAKAVISKNNSDTTLIIGAPFIHLTSILKETKNSNIAVAAQNCHHAESGAFTGEVSASMLASINVQYVIIGHSERREYNAESNEELAKKVNIALSKNIRPIFCCGETLKTRELGKHFEWITTQLEQSVFHLSKEDFSKLVIAYEPIWAIGTGVTASAQQAQEIHAHIRKEIANKYGSSIADNTSILYGGSCKPSNANELFANPDVDGGLIGGASLNADDFIAIANSF